MKTFALETQDEEAKQTFWQIANNLDDALMKLKGRQQYIQSRNHNTDNNNN